MAAEPQQTYRMGIIGQEGTFVREIVRLQRVIQDAVHDLEQGDNTTALAALQSGLAASKLKVRVRQG